MLNTKYYRDFDWVLSQPRPYRYQLGHCRINKSELEEKWLSSEERAEVFSFELQQSPVRLHNMIKKQVDKFYEKHINDGKSNTN